MLDYRHNLTRLTLVSLTFCVSCGSDSAQETVIDYEDPAPASGSTDSVVDARAPTQLRDASLYDPCRSWCAGETRICDEPLPPPFPDYEATVSLWSARCSDAGASSFPFVVEARCADGKTVLHTGNGRMTERRFFDAAGMFVGLLTEVDYIDAICQAKRYWPAKVPCEQAEVTRVFCGRVYTVGQKLDG